MRKLAALITATASLALLLATSVSAQPQHNDRRDGQYDRDRDNRVITRGHIRSFRHERDGYRIYLDRGDYSYWVPESQLRNRRLRVGAEIRLGGVFRGGYVWVDAIGWPGDPYFDNDRDGYVDRAGRDTLAGRVEWVDFRSGRMRVHDQRTSRNVEVDARALESANRRLDLGDVRRGDRITLRGTWDHGAFRAFRIESIAQR